MVAVALVAAAFATGVGCGTEGSLPVAAVSSDDTSRLPTTYAGGSVRFDPPPHDAQPRMTRDEAYQVYVKRGIHADAPKYDPSPSIVLANYTNYGKGTLDESGRLTSLAHRDQLVWVVTFRNVPARGSMSTEEHLMDVVTVVDDARGEAIVTMVDRPDAAVQPPQDSP